MPASEAGAFDAQLSPKEEATPTRERVILGGLILVAFFIFVIAVASFEGITSLQQFSNLHIRSHDVISELEDVLSFSTEVEASARGYIIVGDALYLEPYHKAIQKIHTTTDKLGPLISDNPAQMQRFVKLSPLIEEYLGHVEAAVELRRRDGIESARQFIAKSASKLSHDAIRISVADMINAENVLLTEQQALATRANLIALAIFALSCFLSFGFILAAIFIIHREFTASNKLQHTLQESNVLLEAAVVSRTAELNKSNLQLKDAQVDLQVKAKVAESANQAKSLFLATMSHEIRTPLNAVLGLIGLLADSPLGRHQREYANQILTSAQVLRTLVDDILDFSKIEAGAFQLEQVPFSLNTILRDTATVISVATYGKPIEAFFEVAHDVPDMLVGDPIRLQQILLNLTSNAAKFTNAGEIVVSVRRIAGEAAKITLQFSVRDTGIGIPPEQLALIFEMFSQADASITRQYGGTGLGLAISARLAGLMGGLISVESKVAQGSEFDCMVRLGLPENQPPTQSEEKFSGLRILIIDDHPISRDILQRICANFDWQATTLDSGAAALDELRRSAAEGGDYDLLLLDWHMPGMDGIEMLRQARNTPNIVLPLVVLMASSFELENAAAASDDIHFDGFLAKPLLPVTLLDAVRRALWGESIEYVSSPTKLHYELLAGVRLLVAEDHDINRQVIEHILTRAGAKVVLVADGLAAVEAVRTFGGRFDAVLMDIQMPEMDGYTATRVIREELGLLDLPIIALTANAQPEDREKSLQAGLVGHLVKPIDLDALVDMVIGVRRSEKLPHTAASMAPTIDIPGLDVAACLKTFGGDAKGYGELLRKFLTLHENDVEIACRLCSDGDTQGSAKLIHDIRGVSAFLCATDVARLAADIEKAIKDGTPTVPPFCELQFAMRTLAASVAQYGTMMEQP